VEAQFSPDGKSLVPCHRIERAEGMLTGLGAPAPEADYSAGYSGILTRLTGMRFWSDDVAESKLNGPYPVVRWTDRWGQRWEHKKGVLRKIDEGAPWLP
jgi:hypothetical protein